MLTSCYVSRCPFRGDPLVLQFAEVNAKRLFLFPLLVLKGTNTFGHIVCVMFRWIEREPITTSLLDMFLFLPGDEPSKCKLLWVSKGSQNKRTHLGGLSLQTT